MEGHSEMEFLASAKDILSAVRDVVGDEAPASIAVAFWGRGATNQLGLGQSKPGTKVVLNADSGACNPDELRELMKLSGRVEVRNCPRLHAKTIVSDRGLLVGSANASANGLGLQGAELSGWFEACLRTTDRRAVEAARSWFARVWNEESEPLDEAVIGRAEAAWRRLRQHAQRVATNVLGEPTDFERFEGANIFVVLTDQESTCDEAELRAEALQLGMDIERLDHYQDWAAMPRNALLLSYSIDTDGSNLRFDGVYTTDTPRRKIRLADGSSAYPIYKADKAARHAYAFTLPTYKWTRTVRDVVQALQDKQIKRALATRPGVAVLSPVDWCMPMYEFLRFCIERGLGMPAPFNGGA